MSQASEQGWDEGVCWVTDFTTVCESLDFPDSDKPSFWNVVGQQDDTFKYL